MLTIEEINTLQDTVSRIEAVLRMEHQQLSTMPVMEADDSLTADKKVSVAKMLHTASKTSRDLLNLRHSAEWYYTLVSRTNHKEE